MFMESRIRNGSLGIIVDGKGLGREILAATPAAESINGAKSVSLIPSGGDVPARMQVHLIVIFTRGSGTKERFLHKKAPLQFLVLHLLTAKELYLIHRLTTQSLLVSNCLFLNPKAIMALLLIRPNVRFGKYSYTSI